MQPAGTFRREFGARIAQVTSVGSRKTKNSKETQDHGKSKDSEKGKEARISEAPEPFFASTEVVVLHGSLTAGFAPAGS